MGARNAGRRSPRRLGGEKSKSGCLTCKIRRVKCDETKPHCRRCVDTGRRCEGPTVHTFRFVEENYRPGNADAKFVIWVPEAKRLCSIPNASAREMRAFEYYLRRAAPLMSGLANLQLWSYLIPQLSLSDSFVWNAVMAISSLFEHAENDHLQALSWYSKAIKEFQMSSQHSPCSTSWALLSCLLFTAIEFAQKNHQNGLTLLEKGLRILSKALSTVDVDSSSSASAMILDIVVPFFSRHAVLISTFGQPRRYKDRRWSTIHTLQAAVSQQNFTVHGAHAALQSLMYSSYELVRIAVLHLRDPNLSAELEVRQLQLLSAYTEWYSRFVGFQKKKQDLSAREKWMTSSLLVYYGATRIWLATCLSPSQLIFDEHIPLFRSTVEQASISLTTASCPEGSVWEDGLDLMPPLYFVAMKCRDPGIRRRALKLLRIVPRNEDAGGNFWSVLPIARIAETIIELEEKELREDAHLCPTDVYSELPQEKTRLHEIEVFRTNEPQMVGKLAMRTWRLVLDSDGPRQISEHVLEL